MIHVSLATPSMLTWHRIHANTSYPPSVSVRQAVTRSELIHHIDFPFVPTLARPVPRTVSSTGNVPLAPKNGDSLRIQGGSNEKFL